MRITVDHVRFPPAHARICMNYVTMNVEGNSCVFHTLVTSTLVTLNMSVSFSRYSLPFSGL